jgi:anti-sigma-K factor RskA
MTEQEMIDSGLLEAYVLGQTTAEERRMVEQHLGRSTAVRAEMDAIETTLERWAFAIAVQPAAHLRKKVLAHAQANARAPVVPMHTVSDRWIWLAAASTVGLVFSLAGNFWQGQQLSKARTHLAEAEQARTVLAEDVKVERAALQQAQDQLAVLQDPAFRVVPLQGNENAPSALARVFWNAQANTVFLSAADLPQPPAGKQYQLWAIADGTPVDAGVFDVRSGATEGLRGMKNVTNAQAFAVTLENAGGAATPTLSSMVLLGTV